MEGAPGLESTYPLVVFTFEEETELGIGRSLALGGGAAQCLWRLWRRGNGVEGLTSEERRAVHIGLDEGVGLMDG